MQQESSVDKVARFESALARLIERVSEDRYVLAVVLVGSLSEQTIWRRESLGLWIIEADGVSRRLRSDGSDERIFRILVEDGINVHAEVIPRTRFKKMVEGASRTAFSCNFFAIRKLVYSRDSSIDNWFDQANSVATKDRERELLTFSTWTIYAHRHASRRLKIKEDFELAHQEVLWAAHSVAHTEIIRRGEICESDVIYRAIEGDPGLFQTIYLDVLSKPGNPSTISAALDSVEGYLEEHYPAHLKPLLTYLGKQNRVVPLSEISDHFAFSQLYPWHLEAACEWLDRKGHLVKLSAPIQANEAKQRRSRRAGLFDG